MLKKLELSKSEFIKLKNYCKKKKILFLSTPKSINDARFLNKIGIKIFKIGSGDILDFELLNYISKTKKSNFIDWYEYFKRNKKSCAIF